MKFFNRKGRAQVYDPNLLAGVGNASKNDAELNLNENNVEDLSSLIIRNDSDDDSDDKYILQDVEYEEEDHDLENIDSHEIVDLLAKDPERDDDAWN